MKRSQLGCAVSMFFVIVILGLLLDHEIQHKNGFFTGYGNGFIMLPRFIYSLFNADGHVFNCFDGLYLVGFFFGVASILVLLGIDFKNFNKTKP